MKDLTISSLDMYKFAGTITKICIFITKFSESPRDFMFTTHSRSYLCLLYNYDLHISILIVFIKYIVFSIKPTNNKTICNK